MTMEVDESQRQVVVMALAHLAAVRPGWDPMVQEIAVKLDPQLKMYQDFQQYRKSELTARLGNEADS